MPDINSYITSVNPSLYAGPILLREGRVDTPLISMIGGRRRSWNGEKFIIGQTCPSPVANPNSAVSEAATLTVPEFAPVGRKQETNVVEIHTKSLMATDYAAANRAMLSGPNLAGQHGEPLSEKDFQRNFKHLEFLQDMEYALINSEYFDREGNPSLANKTRGLRQAIKSNIIDCNGEELSWRHLNDALISMADHGAATSGLVLGCDPVTMTQLAQEAKAEHCEIVTGVSKINGIAVTNIQTIKGYVTCVELRHIQPGEAFLLNLPMLSIVEQPTAFGNYYWVPMGRTGLGEVEMFYAAFGLDYGAEQAHARLHNIATEASKYMGTKVFVSNPVVPTTEALPVLSGVTLAGAQVGAPTDALVYDFTGEPTDEATFTYQWKIGNSVSGAFANIEGATEATYTPVAEDAGKYICCEVTASGTAEGTVVSNKRKVLAAE